MIDVKKISPQELIEWKKRHRLFQFIDLRNNKKAAVFDDDLNICFADIKKNIDKIRKDIPVVLACNVGEESYFAAVILEKKYKLNNIYSLSGGINKLMQELV